jgi:RNA polymerase sigma factor (sigma-70 family)
MDPEPPLSARDYWYLGSPDPAIDQLFRRACSLVWPYAVYCAKRYHNDPDFAYDLMDEAVQKTEHYYERFNGQRTALQLSYRIFTIIKRLSKQYGNRNEVPVGMLSDLEVFAQAFQDRTDVEQDAYIRQVLDRMTDRTRHVVLWHHAGHSWAQIAKVLGVNRITLWREVQKEIRGLLHLWSDTHDLDERGESD